MFFGGDPFAGMHGGGGSRRGGGGGMRGGPQADVDTTKLYETLGVSSLFYIISSCTNLSYIFFWISWSGEKS